MAALSAGVTIASDELGSRSRSECGLVPRLAPREFPKTRNRSRADSRNELRGRASMGCIRAERGTWRPNSFVLHYSPRAVDHYIGNCC
jgi:hypothetical protein